MTLAEQLERAGLEDEVREWVHDTNFGEAVRRLADDHGIKTSRRTLRRWAESLQEQETRVKAVATRLAANEARRAAHAVDELLNIGWTLERLNEIADFELDLLRGLLRRADGTKAELPIDVDAAKVRLKAAERLERHIELRAKLAEGVGPQGGVLNPLKAIGDAMREIHSPHADSRLERELARLRADDSDVIDVSPEPETAAAEP